MFGIGAQELAVILVIALLVFGPKRLPELARSLGRGLAEFRRASSDLRQAVSTDPDEKPAPEGPAQAGAAATRLPAASTAANAPAASPPTGGEDASEEGAAAAKTAQATSGSDSASS